MRRILFVCVAIGAMLTAGTALGAEKKECPKKKCPVAEKQAKECPQAAKVKDMKAMFMKKFDKDGDGKISEEEKAAIKKEFEARKAMFMKKFDKDGDGKLDDKEKAAIKKAFMARMQAHKGHGHKGPPQAHRGHGPQRGPQAHRGHGKGPGPKGHKGPHKGSHGHQRGK